MTLLINGETRALPGIGTAAEMLTALGLDARAVVVEINRSIVRRPALATTPMAEGDVVEIVHFVGGG